MTKKPLIVLFLASLIGLVAAAARADDSALLYRATPPPDVLVILDTSQSMTWFTLNGATVGDELCYPTSNCPPPDPTDPTQLPTFASRMWMSKFVLSNVVGSYGDKINFGLASYYQGNAATNVIVQSTGSGSPRSWYYSEGWYKLPTSLFGGPAYTIGNRYYPPPYYFDLRVPQAGRGGPANAADPAGYDPATLHPNSPSFTLTWALQDPSTVAGGQNPAREFWAGQPYIAGTSHNEFRCRYIRQRNPDADNDPATAASGVWTNYGGTWDTLVGAGCPAAGTVTVPEAFTGSVTVTDTCTFVQRLTYDTPTPYQYSCQRYSNGTATGGPWNEYYQNDRGPSFPRNVSFAGAYWERTISLGQVTITVTDSAGQAYRPDQYRWRYYYEATCKANCKNPGKFWQWNWVPSGSSPWGSGWYIGDATAPTYGYTDCKANQVSNPWTDPATLGVSLACAPYRNAGQPAYTPSATGTWGVPLDAEYKWQGNNYALTTDNSCNGGQVLVEVGAGNQDAIKNFLGTGMDPTKELHAANRSTPLGGSLDTALTYFTDPAGVVQTDASKDCRKHYVLLITDGGESCLIDLNVPGQRAAALAAIPPPTLPNGVKTYVVGIDQGGLTADEKNVLNDIAAQGGTGSPKFASNIKALMAALLAIIGNILSEQYTFVNPVVPTVRAADNLMLIQGAFKTPPPPEPPPPDPTGIPNPNTPLWQGILAAYQMDPQGGVATTNQKITAPLLWEAGANLAGTTGSSRFIKTVVGGSLVDFKKTNAVRSALNVTLDVNNNGTLEASTLNWADTDQVIDTVWGNQDGTGILQVPGPAGGTKAFLGDIFHSVPIIVGPPIPTLVDRTFDPANPTQLLSLTMAPDTVAPYRTAHNTRQRLALVGANDGMLHAFNAGTFVSGQYNTGDGSEVWAFIPPQMLPKLQYLAVNQGHQWYFVDGTPRAADVWLDDNNDGIKAADGSEWHTVLVGGFRQGGTGLYALDLTNTTSPTFMWTYPTTGQSWSEPAFGKVKVQVGGKLVDRWVVFAGDGYDPTGTNGKMVHAIDLKTGKALWKLDTSTMVTDGRVAASPIALDLNADGYVDRVYVGTVGGDMLRLDVSAVGKSSSGGDVDPAGGVMVATCPAASPDCWSGGVFFSAGAAQPFFTKAAGAMDPMGNLWIFAGTGDRTDPLLMTSAPNLNRIYGIKDPYAGTPIAALTEAGLTDVTNVNGGMGLLDPTTITNSGWFIALRPGEKEWAETALVFNQQVFFTTYMPGNIGCGDVGAGTIYMVYYLTGGGVTDTALFTATPPVASSRIYQVNAGATTRPVLTTDLQLSKPVIYLANTSNLLLSPNFAAPTTARSTVYWRPIP